MGERHVYRHQNVPHGGFTDPEYGSVGMTEREASRLYDCAVAVIPYKDLDRAVIDDRTVGFCKLIAARDSGRVLGAHVVGEQALEIVQIIAAGMAAKIKCDQLADLELAYPTFTAIVGLAARKILGELEMTPQAIQWGALSKLPAAEWERHEG
jgi:pyruvate/2-oxoglutarate dehydrogenase complex dihydrolipoamide dehydrogenase (E3) component